MIVWSLRDCKKEIYSWFETGFTNSEWLYCWGSAAMAEYFLIGNVFCCWRWQSYCCWNCRCLLQYIDVDAMHAVMLCTSQQRQYMLTGNTIARHTASMRDQRLCTIYVASLLLLWTAFITNLYLLSSQRTKKYCGLHTGRCALNVYTKNCPWINLRDSGNDERTQ